jgi:hypothetical protein
MFAFGDTMPTAETTCRLNVIVSVVWISASSLRWKNRGKSSNVPIPKLTTEILNAAILGMETQKDKLDAKISELRSLLTGGTTETPAAAPEAPKRKRKRFSAASRRKMAMAQEARWAKIKGEPEPPAPAAKESPKPKRKFSAAGRRAIIAATKKRWAAKRAEAAKQPGAQS